MEPSSPTIHPVEIGRPGCNYEAEGGKGGLPGVVAREAYDGRVLVAACVEDEAWKPRRVPGFSGGGTRRHNNNRKPEVAATDRFGRQTGRGPRISGTSRCCRAALDAKHGQTAWRPPVSFVPAPASRRPCTVHRPSPRTSCIAPLPRQRVLAPTDFSMIAAIAARLRNFHDFEVDLFERRISKDWRS